MRITIIGTGYVGLTTGVCFAELGHIVTCLDIDKEKINKLQKGECPLFEPGLDELLKKNSMAARLSFSDSYEEAVPNADVLFFCIDTPSGEYGRSNLTNLLAAAKTSARFIQNGVCLVNKSTAPVGTVQKIEETVRNIAPDKDFDVASNPEFLAEGKAVNNFLAPYRIVIGTHTKRAEGALKNVYAPLTEKGVPLISTSIPSAELIKYAANAFLAMKVSFINEIADFCELVGADITNVSTGMGLDPRIGDKFLHPGLGFGGSCFGKDVRALVHRGEEEGYEFKMIKALIEVNSVRYLIALTKLKKHLGSLQGKKITVLGLAYKAGTDDVRDAQSLRIVFELLDLGAEVHAYDPYAMQRFQNIFQRADEVHYASSASQALEGADAALILTEWEEFKNLNLQNIKERMGKSALIVDGRNMFDRTTVEDLGFTYEGVGR
ncbi:UDP-glucose/GDP-mannose dehydrogenase family protein [Candidatus Uhrbacteria bacterium]|nr:UDP-glucose/GDP-mannose dehydrogenase family protein [Candidatus Uhrbacteria bacterium]